MISPRFARTVATIHKWLGLIVAIQLVIWTATGLFMASFHLSDVRGEKLVHPAEHLGSVDMRKVKLSSTDALSAVAEDRPFLVQLKLLAGQPVYEIQAEIGVFLVSAETGSVISPVSEDLAREIADSVWAGPGPLRSVLHLDSAPKESGIVGEAWAVHFAGQDNPVLYVAAANGQVSPPRTDLWRVYDFFYGLHLMDYANHENANNIWTIALAVFALSTVLFGIVLLIHRFTRGRLKPKDSP
ncbi:MAG TPA: PepSY domain-containing protein [Hyphomonadaceae bacterium]|jgi:uncharacterized iron-regulated membrane protein|nr:PepSY domain-containing protein [Hyphomonadaceae bacterium]